jgi:hypothetical protein
LNKPTTDDSNYTTDETTQTEQIHSDDQTLHKPTTDDSNYTTDETTQTEQIHSDDQKRPFCEPFACCLDPVVVWVSVVYHQGLFLWYDLDSDLLMLGRLSQMKLTSFEKKLSHFETIPDNKFPTDSKEIKKRCSIQFYAVF